MFKTNQSILKLTFLLLTFYNANAQKASCYVNYSKVGLNDTLIALYDFDGSTIPIKAEMPNFKDKVINQFKMTSKSIFLENEIPKHNNSYSQIYYLQFPKKGIYTIPSVTFILENGVKVTSNEETIEVGSKRCKKRRTKDYDLILQKTNSPIFNNLSSVELRYQKINISTKDFLLVTGLIYKPKNLGNEQVRAIMKGIETKLLKKKGFTKIFRQDSSENPRLYFNVEDTVAAIEEINLLYRKIDPQIRSNTVICSSHSWGVENEYYEFINPTKIWKEVMHAMTKVNILDKTSSILQISYSFSNENDKNEVVGYAEKNGYSILVDSKTRDVENKYYTLILSKKTDNIADNIFNTINLVDMRLSVPLLNNMRTGFLLN